MKLYAYNPHSQSAKNLAERLGIKRLKHNGKPAKTDLLINWGASRFNRDIRYIDILNRPENVAIASDKLRTFDAWKDANFLNVPFSTKSKVMAENMLKLGGCTIVERHNLKGHSGAGIRIVERVEDLQDAPLYVEYIHKKNEYRVHVFNGEHFFIQQKRRNRDIPDDKVNWKVRNHDNGFIYANQDVDLTDHQREKLIECGITAVQSLGLDFGAADIVYNVKKDKFYALEVNTACGLSGTTLDKYVEQFQSYYEGVKNDF